MAIKVHTSRATINAREGSPRVVACLLRQDSQFLTFADDSESASVNPMCVKYAIVGCDYGWLHNTAGDIRFWSSYSAAQRFLKRNVLPYSYGDKRDYRKIDLYGARGTYLASTTWARDCREALNRAPAGVYSARYAKA